MTWWAWLLLWTLLVLGAAGVFFLLGRRLWRQGKALGHELGAAADRFSAVADRLAELDDSRVPMHEFTAHPVNRPARHRPGA